MATVLIVDDELSIRRMLGYMLRKTKHTVLAASDGKEALEKLATYPVNALLLDLALPDTDGIAVLQQLRATPAYRDLPIIVLTASSDEHQRVDALEAGADMFLNKLARPDDLLKAIDQVLRKAT
jgi:two-component system chemotaxis response regulator CheY